MSKKSVLVWLAGALVLTLLYLMSSTNLILKDDIRPVYQVSVILRDTGDEYYDNFKKGVEKAAGEFNVDTNILSMYELSNKNLQRTMIEGEMEKGANAVVIEPNAQIKPKEEMQNLSFVVIGDENYVFEHSTIKVDYSEATREIAQKISERHKDIKRIYVFSEGINNYSNKTVYKAFTKCFETYPTEIIFVDLKENENYLTELLRSAESLEESVLFGTDKHSFTAVAKFLEENKEDVHAAGLYGIGASNYLLNKLDEGIVSGIETWDEYRLGYMSIKFAVDMIKNKIHNEEYEIESIFIDGNNLKEEDTLRILYPIE